MARRKKGGKDRQIERKREANKNVFTSTLALHVYVRALSCCPTGVNCFLGVVLSLSFVEKKLVLRFYDFFQNKGREGGRNKRRERGR